MLRPLILACCLLATPVHAETSILRIGQDRYEAGGSVRFEASAVADLFMTGNRLDVTAPVAWAAHLAGRQVTVEAAVAGDLFVAGYGVTVSGAVGGDAAISGADVTLTGTIAGDVVLMGDRIMFGPGARVAGGAARLSLTRLGTAWSASCPETLPPRPGTSEMDALIAYPQVLGTMVDFSTFTPDASR